MFKIIINKKLKNTRKNVYKLMTVYIQNYSYFSCYKSYTFFLLLKNAFYYAVWYGTKLATIGQLEAKIWLTLYVYPLIFLYLSLISYAFINIHENFYLICYKLDHFGKHVVSMHWLKINFGTFGHLTTEIWVILKVHPLDFSAIFHSFLLVSLKFMNIYDKYFSYYTLW